MPDWLMQFLGWVQAHWFQLIVIFLLERCFQMLWDIRNILKLARLSERPPNPYDATNY